MRSTVCNGAVVKYDCGASCAAPTVCYLNAPPMGFCCKPQTCAPADCGPKDDSCGGSVDCGGCDKWYLTCGGGPYSVAGHCGGCNYKGTGTVCKNKPSQPHWFTCMTGAQTAALPSGSGCVPADTGSSAEFCCPQGG
ncbi:MAG: hypothetical protein L6Q84_23530 [Polyangiaceae bacterium]|nr:hypothetical protein [Polyangiaceae bacterium]